MTLTGDVDLWSNVRKCGVLRCCGPAGHESNSTKIIARRIGNGYQREWNSLRQFGNVPRFLEPKNGISDQVVWFQVRKTPENPRWNERSIYCKTFFESFFFPPQNSRRYTDCLMVHSKWKHNTYRGALVTKTFGHRLCQFKVGRTSIRAPYHFGNREFRQHNKVAIQCEHNFCDVLWV